MALAVAQLQIDNPLPNFVQCEPAPIIWQGGTAPFSLNLVLNAGASTRLIDSGITSHNYSWNVNAELGTTWSLKLTDSAGGSDQTSNFIIHEGTNTSCVNSGSTSSTMGVTQTIAVIVGVVVGTLTPLIIMIICILRRRIRIRRLQRAEQPEESQPLTGQRTQYPLNSTTAPAPFSAAVDYYSRTPVPFANSSSSSLAPDVSSTSTFTPNLASTSHLIAPNASPPQRTITLTPPPLPYSPPPPSIATTAAPPAYRMMASPVDDTPTGGSFAVVSSLERLHDNDDEMGKYAAAYRDVIPRDFEGRLRKARYVPTDDPREIPADVWLNQHGVGHFELKRLQELYDRNHYSLKDEKP